MKKLHCATQNQSLPTQDHLLFIIHVKIIAWGVETLNSSFA